MTLHVVYRCAGVKNRKNRPAWFSKSLCLASVLRSGEEHGDVGFTFLCDGPLPVEVHRVMEGRGRVVELGGRGNSASYRATVLEASRIGRGSDADVYVCEDDYLHQPTALTALGEAFRQTPAGAYLALYDHPDRHLRNDDMPVATAPATTTGDHEWRVVESTTMSFAARTRTLRRDLPVHYAVTFGRYPRDRLFWRTLQGLGYRRPLRLVLGRRLLYAARPGLAVHCEDEVLSPGVDWETLATATRRWADQRDLPLLETW
ncbi:MAG: hypothetical protein ACR2MO_06660 [Acidimicrobiales bacterium]